MENLFNVNQAAFILKVHPLTVRRYIKEGKLKAVKIGGGIRIKESQLQEFQNDLIPPSPQQKTHFLKKKKMVDSKFTSEDPFLRLNGRGASIN